MRCSEEKNAQACNYEYHRPQQSNPIKSVKKIPAQSSFPSVLCGEYSDIVTAENKGVHGKPKVELFSAGKLHDDFPFFIRNRLYR